MSDDDLASGARGAPNGRSQPQRHSDEVLAKMLDVFSLQNDETYQSFTSQFDFEFQPSGDKGTTTSETGVLEAKYGPAGIPLPLAFTDPVTDPSTSTAASTFSPFAVGNYETTRAQQATSVLTMRDKVERREDPSAALESRTVREGPGGVVEPKVDAPHLEWNENVVLVVLGANYGKGASSGKISEVLVGCRDTSVGSSEPEGWKTVAKVAVDAAGANASILEDSTQLFVPCSDLAVGGLPDWLHIDDTRLVPDVVLSSDPDDLSTKGRLTLIVEVTAAEFSAKTTHSAEGISLRFPRVVRARSDLVPSSPEIWTLQRLVSTVYPERAVRAAAVSSGTTTAVVSSSTTGLRQTVAPTSNRHSALGAAPTFSNTRRISPGPEDDDDLECEMLTEDFDDGPLGDGSNAATERGAAALLSSPSTGGAEATATCTRSKTPAQDDRLGALLVDETLGGVRAAVQFDNFVDLDDDTDLTGDVNVVSGGEQKAGFFPSAASTSRPRRGQIPLAPNPTPSPTTASTTCSAPSHRPMSILSSATADDATSTSDTLSAAHNNSDDHKQPNVDGEPVSTDEVIEAFEMSSSFDYDAPENIRGVTGRWSTEQTAMLQAAVTQPSGSSDLATEDSHHGHGGEKVLSDADLLMPMGPN